MFEDNLSEEELVEVERLLEIGELDAELVRDANFEGERIWSVLGAASPRSERWGFVLWWGAETETEFDGRR